MRNNRFTGMFDNVENIDQNRSNYYDELSIGTAFAERFKDQICYNTTAGQWMVFNANWRVDEHLQVHNTMKNMVEQQRVQLIRQADQEQGQARKALLAKHAALGKFYFIRGALNIAMMHPNFAKSGDDFDQDLWVAGCPEGYIDLHTGEFCVPSPDQMITMQLGLNPADEAECPMWENFLAEAHAGQEEVIPYLQKYWGYCLTGDVTAHSFTYHRGGGGNGKGTAFRVLCRLLGDYFATAQEEAFTRSKGYKGHDQVLATLKGKRMILVSEPDEDASWDAGRVKAFTAPDAPIKANLMRQDGMEFMPAGKLNVVANKDLDIARVDDAIRRRMRRIDWNHKPKKVDPKLADTIFEQEGPQILRWLLDGLQQFIEDDGLEPTPEVVQKSTTEHLDSLDPVQQFIDVCLQFEEGSSVKLTQAAMVYNEWGRHNEAPTIKRGLGKRLVEHRLKVTASSGVQSVRNQMFSDVGLRMKEAAMKRLEEENAKK